MRTPSLPLLAALPLLATLSLPGLLPAAPPAAPPPPPPGADVEELARENQLLAAELALAGKPQFYLVFDFPARRISLKARGRAFKQWDIRGFAFWGSIATSRPLELLERSAFSQPQRVVLAPTPAGDPAADSSAVPAPTTFEIDALELADMPDRFTLTLEEGIRISVAPRRKGTGAFFARLGHRLWWNGTLPLRSLWSALTGKPYVAIDLALAPEDAQALYWAFPEGTIAILYHPGD